MNQPGKTLDQMTLVEKWERLSDKDTCPYRLSPLVGSKVLRESGNADVVELLVELAPGMTPDAVKHLAASLASFYDLASGAVRILGVVSKARRVRVVLTMKADEEEREVS